MTRNELFDAFRYAPTARSRAIDKAMSSLRHKVERDPSAPEHLQTVFGEGYVFVPVTAEPQPVGNSILVAPSDRFVARETEIGELEELLVEPGVITLVGPGGVGKTRLALEIIDRISLPACIAELQNVRSLDELFAAMSAALGSELGDPESMGRQLAARGRFLVVLDNMEHLVEHAPHLGRLLGQATEATVLVTSRRPLELRGERVYRLEPLDLDSACMLLSVRAEEAGHPVVDDGGLQELAAALDGIPLALELAAARLDVLEPGQLATRFEQGAASLENRRRDAPSRHATMEASLGWSWESLAESQRTMLAELSVFRSDFTLAAVEAVCSPPVANSATDTLSALVRSSLVQRRTDSVPLRFRVLGLVRRFADARLLGSARRQAELRHARHYATIGAGTPRPGLLGDLADVIAGCERAARWGDGPLAVALLDAAWGVMRVRGPHSRGLELTEIVGAIPGLARSEQSVVRRLRFGVLLASGRLEEARKAAHSALVEAGDDPQANAEARALLGTVDLRIGETDAAREHLEAALASFRSAGRPEREAIVLVELGIHHGRQGEPAVARCYMEAALVLHRNLQDRAAEAQTLGNLGVQLYRQGRVSASQRALEDALAIAREDGLIGVEATVLGNLGLLLAEHGEPDAAVDTLQTALRRHREMGRVRMVGIVLGQLGLAEHARGRRSLARRRLREAMRVLAEAGDRRQENHARANLGALPLEDGQLDAAREELEAALVAARQIDNLERESSIHCNLGVLHHVQGRLTEARRSFEASRRIHRRIEHPRGRCIVLTNLGKLLRDQADLASAIDVVDEARSIAETLGDPVLSAEASGNLATLFAAFGEPNESLDHEGRARAALASVADPAVQAEGAALRAEAALLRGDRAGAIRHLAEAESMEAASFFVVRLAIARVRERLNREAPDAHEW